jgi:hypothetical protein
MATKKTEGAKPHKARTHLHHNGEAIAEGATVHLTDEEAAPLLAVKAVEPLEAPAAQKTEGN